MDAQAHQLNTIGYITAKLPDEQLKPIWDEVNKIRNNFDSSTKYNKSLAGNLEHEYLLTDCVKHAFEIVMPFVSAMDELYNHSNDYQILNKNVPYMMHSLWVNFQKKHEFNPLHNHSGIYSFVIWLQSPFSILDEKKNSSSKNSRMNCPAHFQLTYLNTLGQISQELIPVDKNFDGVLCIFPSKMNHQVYPFYTSDDYRISVSGNICFDAGV